MDFGFKAFLDKKNLITIQANKKASFKINDCFLNAELVFQSNNMFIYKAFYEIDLNTTYIITSDNNESCPLYIRYYVKEDDFDEMYYYDKDDLGASYNKEYTTFKLWAPIASKVILSYEINGIVNEVEMIKSNNGVFETKVNGDLKNALYNYKVINNDIEEITLDPYAFSSNANSKKSAVIDLNSIDVISHSDSLNIVNDISDCIIYELSVRDFSMDGSLGEDVKGKFNAFLKHNLKSKKGHPIGIDYIKDLGISHVQLMPILDFATVDEENIEAKYNWGYDPFCYNCIEGSYCSNPNDPYLRIIEAKQMIEQFHKCNIRVVLDVVFNHTYLFNKSIYNKIVPNYFYLMDSQGNLSNGSFCGNDIDSTRKMVHKYICDMCVRYVKLYNIDGLRFDLMGILDKDLIIDIYEKCRKLNPSFIIYGEGWNMPSMLQEDKRASLNNAKQLPQIAFFNDFFRDCVTGKAYKDYKLLGLMSGNIDLYYDFIKAMRGSIENNCYFTNPSSSINYVECHDNYTLYDKLKILNEDYSESERNNIQLLCIAATLFAQGVPFLHCGVEFNRSKFNEENSYNLSDSINMIRWDNVDKYEKNINAVKDFIQIRKNNKCFSLKDRKKIFNCIDGKVINNVLLLIYANKGDVVLLIINPTKSTQNVVLHGDFYLYANQYGLCKKDERIYNKVSIKAHSFMMLTK